MLTCYLIFIGYEITPMDDLIIEENFPAVITARHTLYLLDYLLQYNPRIGRTVMFL